MAGTLLMAAGGAAAWAMSAWNTIPNWLQTPFGLRRMNVTAELGPLLSPSATILVAGSESFGPAAKRWTPWEAPHIDVIVEAKTEEDVSNTVQFANSYRKPFLAIAGTHGGTSALSSMKNGLGISLRHMKDVKIAQDGKSAVVEGGITSGELIDVLWKENKQSVVGACECTGAVSPMLGGGHGWLQGRYGLMADNLISARVVLGNGTAVIASSTENEDLFWALRGAGHNFGIVTSFQYKIYDRTPENEMWTYEMLIFKEDKLEDVYKQANTMIGNSVENQPVELVHWSMIMRMPDFDSEKPIIAFFVLYQGSSIPSQYIDPLLNLQPIFHSGETLPLPGLAKAFFLSNDSPGCMAGSAWQRFPISIISYDITALRNTYRIFASMPAQFDGSFFILEAYSTHGVQTVKAESTAYPDRENNLLTAPMIQYAPGSAGDDAEATRYGRLMRDAMVNGTERPLNAYVNYALGDESDEALYGYEAWRLEKLRRLKKMLDPHGRFSYYNPIR